MQLQQENLHVQSVSFWAPPNIGPYSQVNKFKNAFLLAGQIGLYAPKLCLIDPSDIILQYRQLSHNYNKVLREMLHTNAVHWRDIATSVIIYISQEATVDALIKAVQEDTLSVPHLLHKSIIIRVSALPMNALIEMEMVCDSSNIKAFDYNYSVDL